MFSQWSRCPPRSSRLSLSGCRSVVNPGSCAFRLPTRPCPATPLHPPDRQSTHQPAFRMSLLCPVAVNTVVCPYWVTQTDQIQIGRAGHPHGHGVPDNEVHRVVPPDNEEAEGLEPVEPAENNHGAHVVCRIQVARHDCCLKRGRARADAVTMSDGYTS